MTWMCNLCFPDAVEHGEISPGLSVIEQPDGSWALLAGQGHAKDEVVIFYYKPEPEPVDLDNMPDDEDDNPLWAVYDAWEKKVKPTAVPCKSAEEGWMIVEHFCVLGYDPYVDGHLKYWVFDYVGKWLKQQEAAALLLNKNKNVWVRRMLSTK